MLKSRGRVPKGGLNPVCLIAIAALAGMAMQPAYGQVININATEPCFLKYNETIVELWEGCGIKEDFLETLVLPWEWITGGYLSAIIIAMIIFLVWITYRNALYPMMAGILYMPFAYMLFPETFIIQAFLLVGLFVGIMLWMVMFRQTKDYP